MTQRERNYCFWTGWSVLAVAWMLAIVTRDPLCLGLFALGVPPIWVAMPRG